MTTSPHRASKAAIILLFCATGLRLRAPIEKAPCDPAPASAPSAPCAGEKEKKLRAQDSAASEVDIKKLSSASPFGSPVYPSKWFTPELEVDIDIYGQLSGLPSMCELWRLFYRRAQNTQTDVGPSPRTLLMHNIDGSRAVAINAYNYIQILQRTAGDQQPAYRAYNLVGHSPAEDYFCAMNPRGDKLLSINLVDHTDVAITNIIRLYTLTDSGSKLTTLTCDRLTMLPMPLYFEDNDHFALIDFKGQSLMSIRASVPPRKTTPRKTTQLCEDGERITKVQFKYYKLGLKAILETSKKRTLIINPDNDGPVVIPPKPGILLW